MADDNKSRSEFSAQLASVIEENKRLRESNQQLMEAQKRQEAVAGAHRRIIDKLEKQFATIMKDVKDCFATLDGKQTRLEEMLAERSPAQQQAAVPTEAPDTQQDESPSAPRPQPERSLQENAPPQVSATTIPSAVPQPPRQNEFQRPQPEDCLIFQQHGELTLTLGPHTIEITKKADEHILVLRFKDEVYEYALKARDTMVLYEADQARRTCCFTVQGAREMFAAQFKSTTIAQQYISYFRECIRQIQNVAQNGHH